MNGSSHRANGGGDIDSPSSVTMPQSRANGAPARLDAPESALPHRPRSPLTQGQRSATMSAFNPVDKRPSTAPGDDQPPTAPGFSTHRDPEVEAGKAKRPPRPLVLRSKSEFGARPNNEPDDAETGVTRWAGARHGFEEHYESQQFMDKLANVSAADLLQPLAECLPLAPRRVLPCFVPRGREKPADFKADQTRKELVYVLDRKAA